MDTVFLVCAGLGATLLVCQFVFGLMGFGTEHDTDHDTGTDHETAAANGHGDWLFGMLTIRTAIAALLFFGLGGLSARYYGLTDLPAFGIAIGTGALALYLVAQAMKMMKQLKADGTARIERAIGCTGTVYLRVPGAKDGAGKVHLNLQNRTVEYQAVTSGDELPTGKPIQVVAVLNADTVEVTAV